MTLEEMTDAIKKLQYQISVVGQTIDWRSHPVESLIIANDWSAADLDKAHDIFEKWDTIIQDGGEIEHNAFEADFQKAFRINYQGLKPIVLAFYANGQWTSVCEAYVDSFGPRASVEYHSIMRRER